MVEARCGGSSCLWPLHLPGGCTGRFFVVCHDNSHSIYVVLFRDAAKPLFGNLGRAFFTH